MPHSVAIFGPDADGLGAVRGQRYVGKRIMKGVITCKSILLLW